VHPGPSVAHFLGPRGGLLFVPFYGWSGGGLLFGHGTNKGGGPLLGGLINKKRQPGHMAFHRGEGYTFIDFWSMVGIEKYQTEIFRGKYQKKRLQKKT